VWNACRVEGRAASARFLILASRRPAAKANAGFSTARLCAARQAAPARNDRCFVECGFLHFGRNDKCFVERRFPHCAALRFAPKPLRREMTDVAGAGFKADSSLRSE